MKKLFTMALLCLTLTSCSSTDTSYNANDNSQDTSVDDSYNTVDSTTTPSITSDSTEVVNSLSEDGNWITCLTDDVDINVEVVVSGTFHSKNDESQDIYRKLALYTQDSDKNVLDTFVLTTPRLIVESENFRIQEGIIDADVYVAANGFELKNSTINGNLTFESDEYKKSAKLDEGTVAGEVN